VPVFAVALLLLPTFWIAPSYQWPVLPSQVLRRFDPPPEPWLAGHRGVDLGASAGATVRAAGGGVVVWTGTLAGRGVVSIQHAGGLRTTYEPVTATVRAGDVVRAGDPIGSVEPGHPGCPQAACLHWGLRRGDVYLDPLALLGLGRVRLLPLGRP
jgi:murein DD-endopeptidase MepM/ murein hydrolase activator NlpD